MERKITVSSMEHGVITYELASFGDRFVARFIDVAIITLPSMFLPLVANWAYFALQHAGNDQATIGQKAMGIKLIDRGGKKVEVGQATIRFFGDILNLFTFFIGYLMFFISEDNQCLHDSLSNCLVVKEKAIIPQKNTPSLEAG